MFLLMRGSFFAKDKKRGISFFHGENIFRARKLHITPLIGAIFAYNTVWDLFCMKHQVLP
jgi:hypothetical protein